VSSLSLERAGGIALAALLAISIASFLFVIFLDVSQFGKWASQIDEYYFSACAVHGLHAGSIPIAGCHDNKAPLIFLIYELVFKAAGDFNAPALRTVAISVAFANACILASIAYRVCGAVAAALTVSLLLSSMALDIQLMALKTELVGGLFVSCAILVLSTPAGLKSLHLALAGLFIGAAVVTKQTYAFAGFAIIAWLLLNARFASLSQTVAGLARCAIFALCVLAPFLLFWLSFNRQQAGPDFLASFFLYPLVYGPSCVSGLGVFLRCAGGVLSGLSDYFVLVTMTVGAATALVISGPAALPRRYPDPRWLILLVVLFLLMQLALTPWWFPAYVMMVAGPMALLSGIVAGDYWRKGWRGGAKLTFTAVVILFAGVTLGAAKSWHGNARIEKAFTPARPGAATVPAAASPRYAYQLGEHPDFYARNGLVPASSIQFSWALPGTPETWSYRIPEANSAKRRWLDAEQSRNLSRLYADFSRTPPRYILLSDNIIRVRDASGPIGIPGFQAYLDRNCRPVPKADLRQSHSLYECAFR
jgi:4-amino-4-deoxy-L-arabinose transferase-like glycosyltransferase